MEKTLKKQFLISLLVVMFIAGFATAVPVPADPKMLVASLPGETLGALGLVDSYVYRFTSGVYANKYLYTYKLTSTNIGISFFSIGVDDTACLTLNAADVNYEDEGDGGINPMYFNTIGTPLQSVDAGFFVTPIYSGNVSAKLWFISECAPIQGKGAAYGNSSGAPMFADCDLYTIPEPATIIMLTTGALWGCIRRKKHTV